MPGETDLPTLIRHMKPERMPGDYVYCALESIQAAMDLLPLGMFQEREGITAILPREKADELGLAYSTVMSWIILTVHSSLEAVGLTAAISRVLTEANISCNVVAAAYHDHLFVPVRDAERAMEVLSALANSNMIGKQVVEAFWTAMETNDFHAASAILHEDFVLDWPQSGERVRDRENFAMLNAAYPAAGKWHFEINQIMVEGEKVVTDVTVTDGSRTDRAITFSTLRDGKIWRQVEFWPEPFDPPSWREQWVEKI